MRAYIKQVRQQKLEKFCQIILVDTEGYVKQSCNSIFDISGLEGLPVGEWFPFMESIFPSLAHLPPDSPELIFSKVEKPAPFLQGYYDFTFSKMATEDGEYILWEIYDYTPLYEDFRNYQQKRNELEIQRQILALQKRNAHIPDPAQANGKRYHTPVISISHSDKSHTPAPLAALDTAAHAIHMMAGSVESEDYLDAIHQLSTQIKDMVNELRAEESLIDHAQFGQRNAFYPHSLFGRITRSLLNKPGMVYGLEFAIPQNLPTRLLGEELDIKRIIVGLAMNASKFHSEPNPAISLVVEELSDKGCVLSITVYAGDNPDLSPPPSEVILRLAIIKKLVETHNGQLHIEPNPHFGSRAVCRIPFAIPK